MTSNNETREGFESTLKAEEERLDEMLKDKPGLGQKTREYEDGGMTEDEATDFEKWYQSEFPLLEKISKKYRILFLKRLDVISYIEGDLTDKEAVEFETKAIELVGEKFVFEELEVLKRKEGDNSVFGRFIEHARKKMDEIKLENGLSSEALFTSMGTKKATEWMWKRLVARVSKDDAEAARARLKRQKKKN